MRIRIPFLHAFAVALACGAMHVPAPAQIEPAESQRTFCWVGRPAESCRTFLVAELSGYVAVASTRYTRRGFDGRTTRSMHLTGHGGWEVGAMRNITPDDAVGATLMAGADANGERVAVKARYRRWVGDNGAMDAGAGLMFARRAESHADPAQPGNLQVPVAGLTGDLALGLTDWAGVSVRGDLLFDRDGNPASGVYAGLKLGTRPGIVATLVPLVAAAVIGVAVVGGGDF